MKKGVFCALITLVLGAVVAQAQVDPKYLAGAVPEVDKKVVFTETYNLPGRQKQEIYQKTLAWANATYTGDSGRIVYQDDEKGIFSCRCKNMLIFQSNAISLDRSEINYQLNFFCEDASCRVELRYITYEYNVSHQKEPITYRAEEWITDKEAVNKNKLSRGNGKFRIKTIDMVDNVFNSIADVFDSEKKAEVQKQQQVSQSRASRSGAVTASAAGTTAAAAIAVGTGAAPVVSSIASTVENTVAVATLKSHRKVNTDKIPGNIIKLLTNDWMLITAGDDTRFNMMTATWGGLGVLWDKPVAFCFINPARYTYELMDKGTYYTISFYTEVYRDALQYCGSKSGRDTDKVKGSGLTPITMPSGAKAFEEAWLILECKKVLGQEITEGSVFDATVKKEMTGKQYNKLFAGEIIGVWIK